MLRTLLLLCTVTLLLHSSEAPYGSNNFYPSPDRPVGFCGDGNGFYPGATPVTEFWDGTPVKTTMKMRDRRKGMVDKEVWDLADDKTKNIAWKTAMPAWSNSQPIVVGDRVFSLYEPYGLVCCDANTGKILWTVDANPWLCAGADAETAEWAHKLFEVWRALPYFNYLLADHTLTRGMRVHEWEEIIPILEQKTFPNIAQALKDIDPEFDYSKAIAATLAGCKKQLQGLKDAAAKAKAEGGRNRGFKVNRKEISALHETIFKRIGNKTREWMGDPRKEGRMRSKSAWGYEVGNMTAPVSDGRYVYFETQYGSTMCVDLNGKVIWGKWFSNTNRCPCQSPLLADGVLISMHGVSTLRGLDAASGAVKWSVPTKGASVGKNKGGYYVGSHKIVPLQDGSTERSVLVTTMCNIIRPADGAILGELPWPYSYGPSGGPSVVNAGDIIIRASNGDGGGSPLVAYRLKWDGADKVVTEKLWEKGPKGSPGYSQLVATPKTFILDGGRGNHNVADAATGSAIVGDLGKNRLGGLSDMMAGQYYFWAQEGNRGDLANWKFRRADNKALALFHVADFSNPSKPKKISSKNLLGGTDWPALPAMQRLTPELWDLHWYHSSSWGKPAHRLHSDNTITCQGNRVFIRSMSHLYSIGDPAVAYDWNPDSRPAEISASLK